MGVQTITTPAGEEMVVMPREDYEALVAAAENAYEDGADAAAFASALAAMQPQDLLPAAVTASILEGKGRVRAYREWRGLTQAALAVASGLSPEELNQIESGDILLSRDAAARIATALDVPTGWLAV